VQCAAQLSSNDPAYAAALASQQRGAGYISEQQDLKATGLFVYSLSDALNDPLNAMGDWALQQAKSAGRGATNLGNALLKKIAQNGPQGPYVNPDDLNGPSGGVTGRPDCDGCCYADSMSGGPRCLRYGDNASGNAGGTYNVCGREQ
jgi:filamentous hemagglutinin